ncbi:MAG TPA: ArsR family transcriptional regulator [Dehalococcoidia bacterium]|nr:ArsR family transcriptional regulator [Dehalococcoidia bacterium]
MPETLDTADEIKTIRFRIESIETTQHLLLRGQSKELIKDLLWLFSRDRKLALVYLSLGKQRNQGEIVEHLKNAEGVAISQPTVSRKLSKLEEEGLIEKVGADASGTRWGRKKVVEQVLRLSRLVAEQAKTPKK